MNKTTELPNTQYLNECFTYDPITGDLFWKERPRHHFKNYRGWSQWNGRFAGIKSGQEQYDKAGKAVRRAVGLVINGKNRLLSAHRIIFHLMGVEIPDCLEVDHRDLNPINNAWANLRLGTSSQNKANKNVTANRKNSHLPKGVTLNNSGTRYRAQIGFMGQMIRLGTFDTAELASEAYAAKAQELYGEFARSN